MNNIIKLDDNKYNNLLVLFKKRFNFKRGNLLYKENTNIHEINISKNNILLMRGDLIHKP